MPNHCANDFRVHGSPKLIEEFIDYAQETREYNDTLTGKKEVQDETISCHRFVPYPQTFRDRDEAARTARAEMEKLPKEDQDWGKLPKDGFNSGGYEWCIRYWGTKWGMYDFSKWTRFKRSALIRFQSAWSPPLPVIHAMSEKFPKLRFTIRYYEKGCAFKGVLQVKGGRTLFEGKGEYRGHRGG
jgi:hypothetical protein